MVPSSLRSWFVVHFVADIVFALPLFLAPQWTLTLLGWRAVDPIATRLVAAALFGIGIQSLQQSGRSSRQFWRKTRAERRFHANLAINRENFNALVEQLQFAMDKNNVPFRAQNKLLAVLAPMHRDIITK